MARGLQDVTVKESVASAYKAVAAVNSTVYDKTRAIYIGVSADYTLTIGGSDIAFKNMPEGGVVPLSVTKVAGQASTGDIVLLY